MPSHKVAWVTPFAVSAHPTARPASFTACASLRFPPRVPRSVAWVPFPEGGVVSRVAGKIRVSDRIAAIVDIVRQAAAATEGAEVSRRRAIPHGSPLGNLVIEVRIPTTCPALLMARAWLDCPPKVPRSVEVVPSQTVACRPVVEVKTAPATRPASLMSWASPCSVLWGCRSVAPVPLQRVACCLWSGSSEKPTTRPALLMPRAEPKLPPACQDRRFAGPPRPQRGWWLRLRTRHSRRSCLSC